MRGGEDGEECVPVIIGNRHVQATPALIVSSGDISSGLHQSFYDLVGVAMSVEIHLRVRDCVKALIKKEGKTEWPNRLIIASPG